jgi:predicted phage terminase large subunit-like protein
MRPSTNLYHAPRTRQEQLALIARAAARWKDMKIEEKAEESLLEFAKYVWPVVEPSTPFVTGWVLEAVCEHLEAVSYGYLRRLLINVPPGFTKSLMTDVFFPAWEWGPRNMPHLRYICAAYAEHLTVRDNMRCRNVIMSDRYQKLWGDRFDTSKEQFTKIQFSNDKTGWKFATSVGGIGTGERADRVIVDDPNNPMEVESEDVRHTVKVWFTEVLPDRLNNQAESAIIVIQQRTHEDDVSGLAISREMGYTHLMIPMLHDTRRHCVTVLGYDEEDNEVTWEDPRSEDDELVWPERFPLEIVKELRRDKGEYAFAAQYQQTPVPRGGAIIKEDYWQVWEEPTFPTFTYILASLDTAYTEKQENDASALSIWGLFADEAENPKLMLMYCWEKRLQFHDLVDYVIKTCTVDRRPLGMPRFKCDRLIIEGKAAGLSVAQEIHRAVAGTGQLGITIIDIKGRNNDKVARVHSIEHLFTDNMIFAPDKDYADKMIRQCSMFPKGSHDDLVDSMSMALRYLRDCGFALKREEASVDRAESLAYNKPLAPLYNPF